MDTTAELRRRWAQTDRLRLVREVRTWLTGQGPRPEGLDDHEGRVDLRGIPLSATPMTVGDKDDPTAGVVWDSLDLTGAQAEQLRVFAGTITSCRFDTASLNGLRLWGTTVTDSTFTRADLRSSAPGTGVWHDRRNTWRRVAFDRANLRNVQFTAAVLDSCTFEKTSKLLQLVDCEIIDCTFRGDLNTLLIDGRGHRHPVDPTAFTADFHDAVFHDSSITGYRLDHTALPHQDDLAVVRNYPTVLRAAADWLRRPEATDVETRTSGIFDYLLGAPGGDDTDYCFDLNGYGNPDTSEAVAQALTQAKGSIRA